MAVILAILGVVLFLPHIRQGGFYSDDWENLALSRFDGHGVLRMLPGWVNPGNRPLHNLDYSLVLTLLGDHQHAYVAYTTLLTVAVSFALYAVFRILSLERVHAAMIAGLVLVYPFADATHLWFSATDSDGAVVLYLLGLVFAIRGLRNSGRSAILHHGCAVALFACSIMLYETAAPAIAMTGVLYWWMSGRRAALWRWPIDVSCVVLLLLFFTRHSSIPRTHGLSALAQHAQVIYDQSFTLLARTVLPVNIDRIVILIAVALLLTAGLILYRHMHADDFARAALRRWLLLTVGGLAFTTAALAIFIPSAPYYEPLVEGVGNRINAVPALGLVSTAYALYMLVGTILALALDATMRRVRSSPTRVHTFNFRLASALALALAISTGIRWAHLTRVDISAWDLASRYQLQMLDSIHALAPRLSHHQVLLVFGGPAYTQPGVPVFAASWDLNGAVQLSYNDSTLVAYPVTEGGSIKCTASGFALDLGQGSASWIIYGGVALLDVATHSASKPATASECSTVLPKFAPGPLTTLPPPSV